MEGPADTQRKGPLGTRCLHRGAGALHCLLLARNHYLSVAVVVGRNHQPLRAFANLLHGFVWQAYDGCHDSRHLLAAELHLLGAHGNQPEGIFKVHCTAGYQGGELSQGVASDHIRGRQAFAAEGLAY